MITNTNSMEMFKSVSPNERKMVTWILWNIILLMCLHFSAAFPDVASEFCHPHCFITCLPSCGCCNGHGFINQQALNRRNHIKLKNLERVLKEKDFEVGFVCHSQCKKRCLPSCKFECCRSKHMEMESGNNDIKITDDGFDLAKLLKSVEETQRQYRKLKNYIRNINNTSGAITETSEEVKNEVKSDVITNAMNEQQNRKKHRKKKNHKRKRKHRTNKINRHKDAIKMLLQLEKFQEQIQQKINEERRMQEADSPYKELIDSKAKLKVVITRNETDDDSAGNDPKKAISKIHPNHVHSKKVSKQNVRISKPKKAAAANELRHHRTRKWHFGQENGGYDVESHCNPVCKQYCYPSCKFDCCTRKYLGYQPYNKRLDKNWRNPFTKVSNSYRNETKSGSLNQVHSTATTMEPKTLSSFGVAQNTSIISEPMKNATSISNQHHTTLVETKHQIESLISLLQSAADKMSYHRNVTKDKNCDVSCKKECLPSCRFDCC